MVQGSGEGRARARRLLEDLAVKKAVELFVEQNEEGWGDRTYEYYNSVLDNFAKAFPSLPTELDDILTYVYYHPRRNTKYSWAIGTVRSHYKAIRTFYTWARDHYPGAKNLMILPPPSDRRIGNFGKKRYRSRRERD